MKDADLKVRHCYDLPVALISNFLDVICHFLCGSETTRTLSENSQMANGNYKEDSSLWNLHISLVYWMRTALFWVIMQQVVVISYQRCGISH